MDDILIIHNSNNANIVALHNLLNSLGKISFTVEKEQNSRLNFLDITIARDLQQQKLAFDIYRKPTATDIIIPKNSYNPSTHKHAALNFLINRATTVPLTKENIIKEFEIISAIANKNGYSLNDIQSLIDKIHNKNILKTIYPHVAVKNKYIKVKYHRLFSHKLQKTLNNYNITLANSNNLKISNLLINNRDKSDILEKSGIYKIQCSDCEKKILHRSDRSCSKKAF